MSDPIDNSEKSPSFQTAKAESDFMFPDISRFFAPGFGTPLTEADLLKLINSSDREISGIVPTIIDNDHYIAIGKVAANWAALEMLINSAIWQIAEIPDHLGACVTSQIYTFDGRMKALISILGVRGDFDDVVRNLNKFHEKSRAFAQRRHRTVHDPWVGDLKSGVPQRLEVTADKRLVSGYKPISTRDLTDLADGIAQRSPHFRRGRRFG